MIFNLFELVGGVLSRERWEAAFEAHSLPTRGGMGVYVLMGFIAGLVAVWLYAEARTRFGSGPGTAFKDGVVCWAGSFLIAILAYCAMGLFPANVLVPWGIVSLIETIVATIVGAWVYREEPFATA